MKNSGLIGYSGFVGSTLLRQRGFDSLYRSTNINEIRGNSFDLVVCAGAPAQKWIANQKPEEDKEKIEGLIENLKQVQSNRFVLISTVDVFKTPVDVDEDTPVDEEGLHAYGLYRRLLEKFVEGHFKESLIVRLPGLVGPGLRKNIIFDFLNNNNLHMIESRSSFQFYPMINLWYDIQTAINAGLKLIHLTAEPIKVCDVAKQGFGSDFEQKMDKKIGFYDMKTKYAKLFSTQGNYQYNQRETIQAIRAYAQSESKTNKAL